MTQTSSLQNQLLGAGVHFGHQKRKWNPEMLPYIYAEKKGIHIIDLRHTEEQLRKAGEVLKNLAKNGRSILFVATKKQARQIVTECAEKMGMPYVTERWLGGMLTNYVTIRASIRKIDHIEKRLVDGALESITKKERLQLQRSKEKMEKVLGGIIGKRIPPAALFLVDIGHTHLALSEAKKLGIQTFGMVDTNCNPNLVNFPIVANDDSAKSISVILNYITEEVMEGLRQRKEDETIMK